MPEHQVDASLEAVQATFIHQIEAEPAEAEPGLEVPQTGQQLAHPDIAQGSCIAVSVLEAEVRHATGDEAGQILVGEPCRCLERREHVEGYPAYRVVNWGQIGEILDRAGPELSPHPLVFEQDHVTRRMRRPVDVDATEVVQTYLNSAVAPMQRRVQVESQARYRGLVDEAFGASPHLQQTFFSRRQVTGQELAL